MLRLHRLIEQSDDDVVSEQSVAILAERRVVPHGIVHLCSFPLRASLLSQGCSVPCFNVSPRPDDDSGRFFNSLLELLRELPLQLFATFGAS